jgi:[acyl-carrier-protein] S-malonyltransferase
MGRALAESSLAAREVFAEADETLGFPLSRLCWEGPDDELLLTANTQPAILAVSVAAHRALAETGRQPVAVAGHSLGEYSALVAAGALTLGDALRLVRRRGELMQEAVPVGEGAMAAVLGLDAATVEALAAEATSGSDELCAVANLNAPQQTVLAGHRTAVERAIALAKERGARTLPLPVSAPFHCQLMAPARDGMAPLLAEAAIAAPQVPVVTNVDARPVCTAEEVRDALVRQITSPVRWVESVRVLADELAVELFVEVGPGTVLSGLIRRILPAALTAAVSTPADLEKIT